MLVVYTCFASTWNVFDIIAKNWPILLSTCQATEGKDTVAFSTLTTLFTQTRIWVSKLLSNSVVWAVLQSGSFFQYNKTAHNKKTKQTKYLKPYHCLVTSRLKSHCCWHYHHIYNFIMFLSTLYCRWFITHCVILWYCVIIIKIFRKCGSQATADNKKCVFKY